MIPSTIAAADELWHGIRREAEKIVADDPVFGASMAAAILDHPDLAGAVSHQIGERLGKSPADRQRLARIAREAFAGSPPLVEAATRDLQGIAVHDPATSGFLPPLLNFKGYVALQAWRVSNWLWREGRTDLALLLQSLSSDQLQVSIHPSASIGISVFLDHATGIIIGAFAVIGDEVTILQHVPSDGTHHVRTGLRGSAEAFCSARGQRLSAMSASATSPKLARARWSSTMYPAGALRSACPPG